MRDLAKGLPTQTRVVFALALRETRTRFGQHQLGYLWGLLEPAFFIGTFWAMFAAVDRTTPMGMDIVPFLATGVIPYSLTVKTADRVSLAVDANRAMLFYPHVQPLDLVFARGLLELTTYLVVFVVILGGYALATHAFVIDDVLQIFLGLSLAAVLGVAFGTVLCALTVMNNTVQRIKGPLMRPLFWTSGLFFAAAMIPLKYREYLLWNPILHCVEIVRDGWFPQYRAVDASPGYVLMWIVLLAFAGLTLERRVRTRVQLT
ncbi:MAG TPA: ABC transporter permease [Sandaracinaceae bacterium LLY-WYZ-13_1]|nr:ABC transporter permease [Sandaracinaceae bacterium LLY-WYZ-13_1]